MRVLVCGGRNYNDYETARRVLDSLHPSVIIEGGARGADRCGARYAKENGIPLHTFPALWDLYGKRAGFERNARMLREGAPDLVLAFPGGRGTANMIQLAREAGVQVIEIESSN